MNRAEASAQPVPYPTTPEGEGFAGLDPYLRAMEAGELMAGERADKLVYRIKNRLRPSWRMMVTHRLQPITRRRAQRLLQERPLRLHLGCGPTYLEGWVNIDLFVMGAPLDLMWDLRNPMPFPDGAAEAIFHEHLVEHLPLADALTFLRECRRVLRAGGILRIGVPDAGRYIQDLVRPNGFIHTNRPGRPTPLLALSELVYGHGHLSMWDAPTLCLTLREAGFDEVAPMSFGTSRLEPTPDTPVRAPETLYVEAVRP